MFFSVVLPKQVSSSLHCQREVFRLEDSIQSSYLAVVDVFDGRKKLVSFATFPFFNGGLFSLLVELARGSAVSDMEAFALGVLSLSRTDSLVVCGSGKAMSSL